VEVRPEREIQDRASAACGVNVEILVMVTLLSLAIGNAEVWACAVYFKDCSKKISAKGSTREWRAIGAKMCL
jgi:hypothetical protein